MGMHPHDHHRHYAVTAIATGCERFKVERYKALFSSFIVQQIPERIFAALGDQTVDGPECRDRN